MNDGILFLHNKGAQKEVKIIELKRMLQASKQT